MRFILGNSVSVTENGPQLDLDTPMDFDENLPPDFSVPPASPEPVGLKSTGSLLALAEKGEDLHTFSYFSSPGEYNEPLRAGADDDFFAPSQAHALSDWPH